MHAEGEFCGNCDSHNSFEYPVKVFCSTRHAKNQNPIVDTLWHCDEYNRVIQKCYCVREALKQKVTPPDRNIKVNIY